MFVEQTAVVCPGLALPAAALDRVHQLPKFELQLTSASQNLLKHEVLVVLLENSFKLESTVPVGVKVS